MHDLTRREFLAAAGALLSGCGADSGPPSSGPSITGPIKLHPVSGRFQTGRLGQQLEPLKVRVTDPDGTPLPSIRISFRLLPPPPRERFGMLGGECVLSDETAWTDDDGIALTTPTLGQRAGAVVVESRLADGSLLDSQPTPVQFRLWSYPPDDDHSRAICLLSFNDFHMHFEPWGPTWQPRGGLARLATVLKDLRAANARAGVPTVVLNAGDDFENTLFHDEAGSFEALMAVWDRIGVDFWQVGNHEFHFGVPFLADKLQSVRSSFAPHDKGHPLIVTWGNVDPTSLFDHVRQYRDLFEVDFDDPRGDRLFQQTAVLDTGGIRVGVIGVATDAAVYTQVPGDPEFLRLLGASSSDAQGLTFIDPDPRRSSYIGRAIDSLDAQGVDLILVNSHAGLGFGDRVNIPPGKDEYIARHGIGPVSGRPVDLILSGHSHIRLNHSIFLENPAGGWTGLVQALEGGVFVARVDLVVDTESDRVQWIDSGLIQVDHTLDQDPETAQVVAGLAQLLDYRFPTRKQPLACCDSFLSSRERTVSAMGQLINASFLHALSPLAEQGERFVSLVVPSTYRTDIHPGSIDLDLAYQVLSMHKMDATGTHADTLAYMTFRPGLYDLTFFGLSRTFRDGLTILEYAIELIHSIGDVLGLVIPAASREISLDLVQLGGVSYVLDATAGLFSRVVPGSMRVQDEPIDPTRVYRLAGPHSIISTIARFLARYLTADDALTGEAADPAILPDPVTGEAFTDSGIALWESFGDYLASLGNPGTCLPESLTSVDGRHFRTLQPDLTVNPGDIVIEPSEAFPGETVSLSIRVRNLGETAVQAARIALYVETSPWDLTREPDGFEPLEGFPEGYAGSRLKVWEESFGVGPYPETAHLSLLWTIPEDMPAGFYPVEVRLTEVETGIIDENTHSPYTEFSRFNNSGGQRTQLLTVL